MVMLNDIQFTVLKMKGYVNTPFRLAVSFYVATLARSVGSAGAPRGDVFRSLRIDVVLNAGLT